MIDLLTKDHLLWRKVINQLHSLEHFIHMNKRGNNPILLHKP
jgi:hypothetical protein